MRIIPVLDLLKGQIVRGIAGQRQEYRPIVSKLSASSNPLDVARAFRDHLNFTLFYLADLDAITGSKWSGRLTLTSRTIIPVNSGEISYREAQ